MEEKGKRTGGDDRIRTGEWRFCKPLPYRLATSPHSVQMERKTRFELATSSLARRRSTAELLPLTPILVPRERFELSRACAH